jgi:hypothetical protein
MTLAGSPGVVPPARLPALSEVVVFSIRPSRSVAWAGEIENADTRTTATSPLRLFEVIVNFGLPLAVMMS